MQYAEWEKFSEAWFPISTQSEEYFTYKDEEGRDLPLGFLIREEAEMWLENNHAGIYSLVVIQADAILSKWGHYALIVYDINTDWQIGDAPKEELCVVN